MDCAEDDMIGGSGMGGMVDEKGDECLRVEESLKREGGCCVLLVLLLILLSSFSLCLCLLTFYFETL